MVRLTMGKMGEEVDLRDLSQEPTGARGPFGGEILYNANQGILYDSKVPYGPTYQLFGTSEPFEAWFRRVKGEYDREQERVLEDCDGNENEDDS